MQLSPLYVYLLFCFVFKIFHDPQEPKGINTLNPLQKSFGADKGAEVAVLCVCVCVGGKGGRGVAHFNPLKMEMTFWLSAFEK